MFLVEIRLPDEDNLANEMQAMRTWLDHQKFEPTTFRHTLASRGVVFRVDFIAEAEAVAFAAAFGGRVMPITVTD